MFLLNLLLALAWILLTGDFGPINLCIGFILGYFALRVGSRADGASNYAAKLPKVIGFFFFFVRELVWASLRVAFDIVTLTHHMKPAVVAVPLDVTTDAQITLLANLITLTPGTLSLDVSDDRKTLYVHVMYLADKVKLIAGIKNGFERRVLEVTT